MIVSPTTLKYLYAVEELPLKSSVSVVPENVLPVNACIVYHVEPSLDPSTLPEAGPRSTVFAIHPILVNNSLVGNSICKYSPYNVTGVSSDVTVETELL